MNGHRWESLGVVFNNFVILAVRMLNSEPDNAIFKSFIKNSCIWLKKEFLAYQNELSDVQDVSERLEAISKASEVLAAIEKLEERC